MSESTKTFQVSLKLRYKGLKQVSTSSLFIQSVRPIVSDRPSQNN
jgi:hypothetical protein